MKTSVLQLTRMYGKHAACDKANTSCYSSIVLILHWREAVRFTIYHLPSIVTCFYRTTHFAGMISFLCVIGKGRGFWPHWFCFPEKKCVSTLHSQGAGPEHWRECGSPKRARVILKLCELQFFFPANHHADQRPRILSKSPFCPRKQIQKFPLRIPSLLWGCSPSTILSYPGTINEKPRICPQAQQWPDLLLSYCWSRATSSLPFVSDLSPGSKTALQFTTCNVGSFSSWGHGAGTGGNATAQTFVHPFAPHTSVRWEEQKICRDHSFPSHSCPMKQAVDLEEYALEVNAAWITTWYVWFLT